MLRTSFTRNTSLVARSITPLTGFTRCARIPNPRFQSTKPSPQNQSLKAALEKNDDLQRDWDARNITYEELKPKTENPTPV